jgi:hypothetical protein
MTHKRSLTYVKGKIFYEEILASAPKRAGIQQLVSEENSKQGFAVR